jgi:hypothetical protein
MNNNAFTFGKSQAALLLYRIVCSDPMLQAKVMRHISDYFRYVDIISEIADREVRVKALSGCMECNLDVPTNIKTLIRNIKVARRREALHKK